MQPLAGDIAEIHLSAAFRSIWGAHGRAAPWKGRIGGAYTPACRMPQALLGRIFDRLATGSGRAAPCRRAASKGRFPDMTEDEVLAEFRASQALLEGHFLLSSGRHSALLPAVRARADGPRARRPARPARWCRSCRASCAARSRRWSRRRWAGSSSATRWAARSASRRSSSSGRPARSSCAAASRIDEGEKVLMVEDVVTTGLSSREAIKTIEAAGGEVIAAAALVDRTGGAVDLGVPFHALVTINFPTYAEDEAAARARRDAGDQAGEPQGSLSASAACVSASTSTTSRRSATRAAATIPIRCARPRSSPASAATASPRTCARTGGTSATRTCGGSRKRPTCRSTSRWRRPTRWSRSRCATSPHAACIVPEKREERTTEGGLDAAGQHNHLQPVVSRLLDAGIRVSLFIAPDERQLEAALRLGAPVVEFHTGEYAHAEGEQVAVELQAGRRHGRARRQERHRAARRARPDLRQRPADRRHPAARRAQHRPLPRRRGGVRRARGGGAADARADGRGADDHRHGLRPVQHRAHPGRARPARRAVRAALLHRGRARQGGASGRSPAPALTPSASPPRRRSPRRSAPGSSAACT